MNLYIDIIYIYTLRTNRIYYYCCIKMDILRIYFSQMSLWLSWT